MKNTDIKNALVIYHREDNDGVCSAAIISQFLKKFTNNEVKIKFFGCNYTELSTLWQKHIECEVTQDAKIITHDRMNQWVNNFDRIYMVDISFNEMDAMEFLFKSMSVGSFIWCDHHRPVIDFSLTHTNEYEFGNTPGIRNTDRSAILNTWEHMVNETDIHIYPTNALVMLSDYDSWAWVNKDEYIGTKKDELFALNTGFTRRSNLKVDWFEDYIYDIIHYNKNDMVARVNDCLEYGMIILTYDRERNERAIKSHGDTSWTLGGEKACAIFTTDRFNSQSFTSVFDGTEIKHGIVFKREPDGRWIMSVYNVYENDDFDCGAYLKSQYGGGGHKGVAGCTISEEQFIEFLHTKTI